MNIAFGSFWASSVTVPFAAAKDVYWYTPGRKVRPPEIVVEALRNVADRNATFPEAIVAANQGPEDEPRESERV
jgi:hypothetical protein